MHHDPATSDLRQRMLLDQLEITQFITTNSMLGDSLNPADWARYVQRYADRIRIDYSATLGDSNEIDRDVVMPYWRSIVVGFDSSMHTVTNVVVSFDDEDNARTRAYVVTHHTLGDALWSCGGIYEHGVRRATGSDGGWKITAQRFTPLFKTGDHSVFERGIAQALPSPFKAQT